MTKKTDYAVNLLTSLNSFRREEFDKSKYQPNHSFLLILIRKTETKDIEIYDYYYPDEIMDKFLEIFKED